MNKQGIEQVLCCWIARQSIWKPLSHSTARTRQTMALMATPSSNGEYACAKMVFRPPCWVMIMNTWYLFVNRARSPPPVDADRRRACKYANNNLDFVFYMTCSRRTHFDLRSGAALLCCLFNLFFFCFFLKLLSIRQTTSRGFRATFIMGIFARESCIRKCGRRPEVSPVSFE